MWQWSGHADHKEVANGTNQLRTEMVQLATVFDKLFDNFQNRLPVMGMHGGENGFHQLSCRSAKQSAYRFPFQLIAECCDSLFESRE